MASLDYLLDTLKSSKELILAGDININILAGSNDNRKSDYLCLTSEHGLVPAVTIPTRENSCIDHILVRTKCESKAVVCKTSVTDHDIPIFGLKLKCENSNTHSPTQQRKTDFSAVAAELEKYDWSHITSNNDVEEATQAFTSHLNATIEKHTCEVNISRSKQIKKPWITPGILRCTRHRDKLHLKCRKHPKDPNARLIYNRYKNFCNNLLHKIKSDYENKLLTDSRNDTKKLWGVIKNISEISNNKTNASTTLLNNKDTPKESLNDCNKYFTTI